MIATGSATGVNSIRYEPLTVCDHEALGAKLVHNAVKTLGKRYDDRADQSVPAEERLETRLVRQLVSGDALRLAGFHESDVRKDNRDPGDGREEGHGRDEVLEGGERRGIHGGVTKASESEGDRGVDPRVPKSVHFGEDFGSVTVLTCKPV